MAEIAGHDEMCQMVRFGGVDVCDCGFIKYEEKKEEVVANEFTIVFSQFEEGMAYIRKGDGSHSSQDVATIHFKNGIESEEGMNLMLHLSANFKVLG